MAFVKMVYIYILNIPGTCLLLFWCLNNNLHNDDYWYLGNKGYDNLGISHNDDNLLQTLFFLIYLIWFKFFLIFQKIFKHLVCHRIQVLKMRLLHINCASICWYYFYEKNFAIYKNIILCCSHNAKIKLQESRYF